MAWYDKTIEVLAGGGFRVKQNVQKYTYANHDGVGSITATKGHVYIKAYKDWYSKIKYDLYVRNCDGGYNITHRTGNLPEMVAKAEATIAEGEVSYPKYTKDELPQAFDFNSATTIHSDDSRYEYDLDGNRAMKIAAVLKNWVSTATILDIVSVDQSRLVSKAVYNPEADAWFYLRCRGYFGEFDIITDGYKWYHARRDSKGASNARTRIRLSRKHGEKDIELSYLDQCIIQAVIKSYVETQEKGKFEVTSASLAFRSPT